LGLKTLQFFVTKPQADNFQLVAAIEELVNRTRACGDGPLSFDRKTRQVVRIRDDAKLLKLYPCYYLPTVTRIEYSDGSVWQP